MHEIVPAKHSRTPAMLAVIGCGVILLVAVGFFAYRYLPSVRYPLVLLSCKNEADAAHRRRCAYDAIEWEMRRGSADAMQLFAAAIVVLPDFTTRGCHGEAHKVGDYAYYRQSAQGDLTLSHTVESAMCDYGFYHGFFEHYFQNQPSEAQIKETCSQLPQGPDDHLKPLRSMCYLAAGHGLALAQAERVGKERAGTVSEFVDVPIAICDALNDESTPIASQRCAAGVFAEMARWAVYGNYGFSFATSSRNSFSICDRVGAANKKDCVYALANISQMKYEGTEILATCAYIEESSGFLPCVRGTLFGQFINGTTEASIERALSLCDDPVLKVRGRKACFSELSGHIAASSPADTVRRVCDRFPSEYRASCEDQ